MDNNKRLETILKIREIRNKIANLDVSLEEKEVLKRSLNLYEDNLDYDIARENNNIIEFQEQGIESNQNQVLVPLEENTSRYKEYATLKELDLGDIIDLVISKISKIDVLNEKDKELILISLKNYCIYLNELEIKRKHYEEDYGDEYKEVLK